MTGFGQALQLYKRRSRADEKGGRKTEKKKLRNTEQKKTPRQVLALPLTSSLQKKKTQDINFHIKSAPSSSQELLENKNIQWHKAKESRRKRHMQTRGTTALQTSSPSSEVGMPILHPVLHSLKQCCKNIMQR